MRHYLSVNFNRGYPGDPSIYYECMICGNVVPSLPKQSLSCKCSNIHIDIGQGRVAIRDLKKIRVYEEKDG